MINLYNIKLLRNFSLSLNVLITLVLITVTFAFAVKAEDKDHHSDYYSTDLASFPYYIKLNAGLSSPEKPKGGFEGSFSKAGLYEFEMGYKLTEDFHLGLNFGYRSGFKNKYSTSSVIDYDQISMKNFEYKTRSYSWMLNTEYDVIRINGLTPYLGLGVGMSHNTTKGSEIETIGLNEQSDHYAYPAGKKNNFAYKVSLGNKFESSNNSYFIDLRYQFVDLGKITTGRVVATGLGAENTTSKTGKLRAHEVLFGIGYKL